MPEWVYDWMTEWGTDKQAHRGASLLKCTMKGKVEWSRAAYRNMSKKWALKAAFCMICPEGTNVNTEQGISIFLNAFDYNN